LRLPDVLTRLAALLLAGACQSSPRASASRAPAEPHRAVPVAVASSTPAPAAITSAPPAPPPLRWPPRDPGRIQSDWCTDAVSALDESACFVLPDTPTQTLLIYLHGIVPPQKDSVQKSGYQGIVARASRRAGVAALMPRGRRGLAPKGTDGWWGWPTSLEQYRRWSAALVESIVRERRALEQATGITFTRTYVAGSSSGGWFAAALALYGGLEADGYGVMSGGASWGSDALERLPKKPVYIGYGTYDTVGAGARQLAKRLESAGWPVRIEAHPVGHGAQEIYLDEAFAFWASH
jgi:predicted esterase